jgi:hypothetical protein
MGRVVALKVINPRLVEDSRARDWFQREWRAVSQLCHPNIVLAYDANEIEGVLFLAMEYIDGLSLDAVVRQRGPLPAGLACAMMRQAALALQYAHEKGMVHRDIKPANLLIARGPAPLVKVVDFGLARLHDGSAHTLMLQKDKSFVGTPDYVSPEQACDIHSVDIRSDLYSLGCTFYFALSGERPFRGSNTLETVVKHLHEEARPLSVVRPGVPRRLAAAIGRLMAKDPRDRFQTPGDLITELTDLVEAEQLAADTVLLPATAETDEPENLPATAVVSDLAFWTAPEATGPLVATADAPRSVGQASSLSDGAEQASSLPHGDAATAVLDEVADVEETEEPAEEPDEPADKARPVGPALRKSWKLWTATVKAVARAGQAQEVDPDDYCRLHGELLAACRSELAGAGGARPAVLRRMEALVEPWLTPYSLASADRAALASLLQRCRHLTEELGTPAGLGFLWRWAVWFGLILGTVALSVWLTRQQSYVLQAGNWLRGAWGVAQANVPLFMVILLPLGVLAALFLFSRSYRT